MKEEILNKISFAIERVRAYGHENVQGLHRTTLEITREAFLTLRGDCIVAVKADKGLKDFSKEFKEIVKRRSTVVIVLFVVDNTVKDVVTCHGDPRLTYSSDTRIIIRRSNYVDGSTACIKASKAARDLDRSFIELMKNRNRIVEIYFIALDFSQFNPIDILVR